MIGTLRQRLIRLASRRRGHRPPALDPQAGYDLWAATYDADAPTNPVVTAERRTMEARLPSFQGRVVLDLACGTGHYALRAAQAGARLTVGVDRSAGMLRQARSKAASLPVALVQADQSRLPLASHAFEVVVHALGAGYAPDLRPLVAELARVLRPGGVGLVSDLHPDGVRRGWRRTFACQEGDTRRQVALKSHPHRMEDYRAAFEEAGLSIIEVVEPRIDEALRPIFAAADALAQYEQHQGQPLLVVFRVARPS